MVEFGRRDWLLLVHHDRAVFDSRARRDQYPFLNSDMVDVRQSAAGEESRYKMYSATEALYTIIADELNAQVNTPLHQACSIAAQLSDFVVPHLPEIVASAAAFHRGQETEELFCGFIKCHRSDGGRAIEFTRPVYGTMAAMADLPRHWPTIIAWGFINLTRAAALLKKRADEHHIDLGDFWPVEGS